MPQDTEKIKDDSQKNFENALTRLEEIAAERSDIIVAKVDVDQHPEFAAELGIDAIPAVFCFREGKESARVVGFMDKASLLKKLGL